MAGTNLWNEEGVVRKNMLLRARLTLAVKSSSSGASGNVGDYYEFNCKSKGLPSFADAPTWTDVTDNPSEPTGYAYAGKSEQISVIELVTRTPLELTYGALLEHQKAGDVFTLSYTYDDPHESLVYSISIANCQIIGVGPEGGDNASGSQMTIKLLAEGGSAGNMPTVTSSARS